MYIWIMCIAEVIEVTAAHCYKYNMEVSPFLFPAKLCGSNFETAFHFYYYFFLQYMYTWYLLITAYTLRIVMDQFQIGHLNVPKICIALIHLYLMGVDTSSTLTQEMCASQNTPVYIN